jgi:magnesium transporter
MEITPELLAQAHHILARANSTSSTTQSNRPPVYKAIGLTLAISSGLFIGTSFVLKKTGLLKANAKYNEEAGEGYGYLKNAYWWTGMTLMIIGEVCNFVAYAFVDAILVTPLGALSVVITTVLSAIFLKERLSFVGKVGCFNCIVGSVVIVLNAPQQSSVATIQDMKHFVLAPGFLSYAGVIIVGCAFIALWVGPRYGKKSMLVYLSICSLIGGLSVVATQGLGAAVVAQASGKPQFNQWFLYVLLAFVITTLVTEIIFLNVSNSSRRRKSKDTERAHRKPSISLMQRSSLRHITFSSRAPPSSPPPFSSKVSRVHPSASPLSSWASYKFVPGSCCCNCPNPRKTCPMQQYSRVISTKYEK